MKVLLSGATGVLGRRVLERLVGNKHTVVAVARSAENEETIRSLGGTPRRADLFDAEALAAAGKGCDVFIHAATSLRRVGRLGRKDLARNDLVRRAGAAAMAEAAGAVGAKRCLLPSVVWVAAPDDGSPFDEDAPYNPDAASASAMLAEKRVRAVAQAEGFAAQILRFGVLYAPDAVHTRALGKALSKGRPVLPGTGAAVWSLIHADDAASAVLAALRHGKAGLWHVVDEEPISLKGFMDALAQRMGAEEPKPLAGPLARLVLGKHGYRLVTRSFPTQSHAFRTATGWKPAYPNVTAGLDAVAKVWSSEGFPATMERGPPDAAKAEGRLRPAKAHKR